MPRYFPSMVCMMILEFDLYFSKRFQILVLFSDKLYLILAIFYSRTMNSHATDSLVYEFDLKDKKASLVQSIPTDGAKSVQIFPIPDVGIHALIGCVKGRAESLLLRFNPVTRQVRNQ